MKFETYSKAALIDLIKELEFTLTSKQAECDDWQATAEMARAEIKALKESLVKARRAHRCNCEAGGPDGAVTHHPNCPAVS